MAVVVWVVCQVHSDHERHFFGPKASGAILRPPSTSSLQVLYIKVLDFGFWLLCITVFWGVVAN